MAEFYRVKEAFAYGNAVAPAGEIWSDENPAFRGREQFFEPVAAAAARSTVGTATETADASPGVLRTRSRRSRRKDLPTPPEPSPTVTEPVSQEETPDA